MADYGFLYWYTGGATACLTLRAVLDEIGRVTEWYQLGIELEVDTPTLKTIEANHKSDLYRCKTEAVDWWLLNAAHPSWATLAKAVEKLGGHANLVTTLRQRAGMECSNGEYIPISQKLSFSCLQYMYVLGGGEL